MSDGDEDQMVMMTVRYNEAQRQRIVVEEVAGNSKPVMTKMTLRRFQEIPRQGSQFLVSLRQPEGCSQFRGLN